MSRFLHHEPCPNCGSRDNVGVFDDGHKWCFGGCGYYIPPTELSSLEDIKQWLNKKSKEHGHSINLPDDFSYNIPNEVINWLKKYGLSDQEICKNHIGWTEKYSGLVYPIFDLYGNLLMYQTRKFPRKGFHTEGKPEKVDHIIGDNNHDGKIVVVVEDMVSTIVVGRHLPTLCLFGSSIQLERIKRLSARFENLAIWLDKDKMSYAMRQKIKANIYFDSVKVIITDKDPKENSDGDIQRIKSQLALSDH